MGKAAARLRPSFVVSTGDNFYSDGVANASDPGWWESFESVYASPSLQVPWYAVMGNHGAPPDRYPLLHAGLGVMVLSTRSTLNRCRRVCR